MQTAAVILDSPRALDVRTVGLRDPSAEDTVVEVAWSGISTGTERLLWDGRMPAFPGMGYPLVPGYEAFGRVVDAGASARHRIGETVFVGGSNAFLEVKGLFGGAARHLVVPAARAARVDIDPVPEGVLVALAATARHAVDPDAPPELVVGHGALGRLIARMVIADGHAPPTVWEIDPTRMDAGGAYEVVRPEDDPRRDYAVVCDASGDDAILDSLVSRCARDAEIVLAGFYEDRLSFAFAPAFMRALRLRIAAEWTPADLARTLDMIEFGRLRLDGLVTHRSAWRDAPAAYRTAFGDPACLKMVLDWEGCP
jgi:3-hydroxyethyl bacteriochlorophyllide a dehydrogenase